MTSVQQRQVEPDDCQPERIYLFGSRARGNAGADSDYDIMVVVATSEAFDSHIH